MKRFNKHALRIFIAASAIVAAGGAVGIFIPQSIVNSGRYSRETIPVKSFFGNSKLDPELDCTKVFEVERQVPKTEAVAKASLEALLAGPTYPEEQNGYFSSLNSGIKINRFSVRDGIAYVDLSRELTKDVEGTCRAAAIRAEISTTLRQFPAVKDVVITVEGKTNEVGGEQPL